MTQSHSANPPRPLGAYIAVTAAYWAFMLTDGALRMLVLLHFHRLGFSPVQLAYLFVLYEVMGIVTNLSAGWIAARFGLTATLYGGLAIQIVALLALSALDPRWTLTVSVIFVMGVQGLSGIAKDLSKMSSKSAVKLLAPADDQGTLFKWVAILTGSKNAVKGFGFMLGAALLALFGFDSAVLAMAAVLAAILLAVMLWMPAGLPKGRKSAKFSQVFSKNRNVNTLSAARLFLFGARDCWFVVGIPIFFYGVLHEIGGFLTENAFFMIGGFMACWIIFYGSIQACAPKLIGGKDQSLPRILHANRIWVSFVVLIPACLTAAVLIAQDNTIGLLPVIVVGLLAFGGIFALNSALHSYLILAFTNKERVTMDVGFYYMSNAAGRLLGTVLSGVSYQIGGVAACLGCAALLGLLSLAYAARLQKAQ